MHTEPCCISTKCALVGHQNDCAGLRFRSHQIQVAEIHNMSHSLTQPSRWYRSILEELARRSPHALHDQNAPKFSLSA